MINSVGTTAEIRQETRADKYRIPALMSEPGILQEWIFGGVLRCPLKFIT